MALGSVGATLVVNFSCRLGTVALGLGVSKSC